MFVSTSTDPIYKGAISEMKVSGGKLPNSRPCIFLGFASVPQSATGKGEMNGGRRDAEDKSKPLTRGTQWSVKKIDYSLTSQSHM